jgi:hypothetical protein
MGFLIFFSAQIIFISLSNNYLKVVGVSPFDISTNPITFPGSTIAPTVTKSSLPNYPFYLFALTLILNICFIAILLKKKE